MSTEQAKQIRIDAMRELEEFAKEWQPEMTPELQGLAEAYSLTEGQIFALNVRWKQEREKDSYHDPFAKYVMEFMMFWGTNEWTPEEKIKINKQKETTPSQPDLTRPIEVSFESRVDPGYYTHYSLYPRLSNSEFSDLMSESNREPYRRLFEAAPDLLKVAEDCLVLLSPWTKNSHRKPEVFVELWDNCLRNIEAAINKAKGV